MSLGAPTVSSETWLEKLLETPDAACIKCGFCLPKCPTYRVTGIESASPRGRIHLLKLVAKGRLQPADIAAQLDLCLGCRACETACPAGVKFGRLLEAGREQTRLQRSLTPWQWGQQRLLYSGLLPHLKRLDLLIDLLWLYQSSGMRWLVRRSHLLRLFSETLADAELMLPDLPTPLIRQRQREQTPAAGYEQRQVGFLAGCVMRSVFAPTNAATVRILSNNGCRVLIPRAVGCCGALHAHAGDLATARLMAQHNIEVFESTDCDAVLVNSAGCGAMLKEYGELLERDGRYAARAAAFSAKVKDISEFLAGLRLNPHMAMLPLRVAYDDPCHLLHGQGIGHAPRQLLQQIPGLKLVAFKEADWCCGSAGTYNLTQPEMSRRLLERKMQHIAVVDPDVIATGNPGCLLQLAWGVKRAGLRAEVLHPIDLLDRAYQRAPAHVLPPIPCFPRQGGRE
jgi:glycolate oxidase iron-sulfur subunit